MSEIAIREASEEDFPAIWEIFHQVVQGGDTYAYSPETSIEEAKGYWMGPGIRCYVAELEGKIVGTYIVKANQPGLGSHVANASFMVHPSFHRRGIGRKLGEHALEEAKRLGFLAMQFNIVIATNLAAVALWEKMGFTIVGTVPKAFKHRKIGYVDIHVMYKEL